VEVNEMEYLTLDPEILEMEREAKTLRAARRAGEVTDERIGLERALRKRLEAMLDARGCTCACGEAWWDCECRYCSRRIANRDALLELDERESCEVVPLAMGDVEALAGVLSRLARDGRRGSNFAIADVRGTDVYVQFAGSPRETTMLWEAVAVGVTPAADGVALLRELGFDAPGEGSGSPNYHQEVALGDDRDATLLRMALATFRILGEGYGCASDAAVDVVVRMEAWKD
jgi:hypothetical protein